MRSKGYTALVLGAVAVGLLMPASALAAKPAVTTGGASKVTFGSAQLNGSVDPNERGHHLLLPVRHDDRARQQHRRDPRGRGRQGRA